MELWCLINWATDGRILGERTNFQTKFIDKIIPGQDPNASHYEQQISELAANKLMHITRPILLQRKKIENKHILKLTEKLEMVVWIPLSNKQRQLYEKYLHNNEAIESVLTGERKNYPIEVINHLKTLCRHPFLLEASEVRKKMANGRTSTVIDDADDDDDLNGLSDAINAISINNTSNTKAIDNTMNVFEIVGRYPSKEELVHDSVKLQVLLSLVRVLLNNDHRILIFSQSKLMLDIIQKLLAENGQGTCRIDGGVVGKERQRIIESFNDTTSPYAPSICLLTTRACGYGITLTGADRVIIYDPSWNPAEDRQAVDRAFRIGQKKDVVVYRMIMASAVEEKMYEKQVFKDGLRIVTESGTSKSRYFSKKETKELFTLGPTGTSLVMNKLWAKAGERLYTIEDIGARITGVLGYSRHDLLYEENRPESIQRRNISASSQVEVRDRTTIDLCDSEEEEESDDSESSDDRDRTVLNDSEEEWDWHPTKENVNKNESAEALTTTKTPEYGDSDEEWSDSPAAAKPAIRIVEIDLVGDDDDVSIRHDNKPASPPKTNALEALTTMKKPEYGDSDEEWSDSPVKKAAPLSETSSITGVIASPPKKNTVAYGDSDEEWSDSPVKTALLSEGSVTLAVSSSADVTVSPPKKNAVAYGDSDEEWSDSPVRSVGKKAEASIASTPLSSSRNNFRKPFVDLLPDTDESDADSIDENEFHDAIEFDEAIIDASDAPQINPINIDSSLDYDGEKENKILVEGTTYSHFKKVKVPLLTTTGENSNEYLDKCISQAVASNPDSNSAKVTLDARNKYKNVKFHSKKPFNVLSKEKIDEYNESIHKGQLAEMEKDKEGSLASYMNAFNICDEDILLHGKVIYLAEKLQYQM
jgi:superfamily II DNA/RNA helicase